MKKKIIKSLKISSLLGFVSNNIKADYKLSLLDCTDFDYCCGIEVDLKGDNKIILNAPEECEGKNLSEILKNNNKNKNGYIQFKKTEILENIKKNFVPIYYKLKSSKDYIIIEDNKNLDGTINFDCPENVEEVIWVEDNTKTNKVICSNDNLKNLIESKKFEIDKNYIYKVILKIFNTNFKDLDDVKKHFYINIKPDKNDTYNIEIIYYHIFKIPDFEEFKISEEIVKGQDFITPLNKLENLYVNTNNIGNVFDNKFVIKKEANLYIFEYKSKKYYIISDKEHKQNELFGFLKTKNNLKDKGLIFDPNGEIKIEEGTGNLVPGEYKIIEKKPKEKPEEPKKSLLKYKFTGDISLSKWIGENFEVSEKVEVQSLFDDQDTSKYVFVAIKEGTNERFINNQIIEPGTYELKREEKPKKDEDNKNKKKEKGGDQGDPEKARKSCSCC